MDNRFENFTYLVLKIGKIIQRIKNIEMTEYGLRAVHVMCIYYLSKFSDGLTNRELANLTFEDKAAISRSLALLQEKEIIVEDSKKYKGKYTLTEYGLKIADYICERSNEAVEESGNDISPEERKQFYFNLRKIERNIEKYYEDLLKTSKKTK